MPDSKYLLYIDILGFTDLVKTGNEKINELFTIVDTLNVHKHDAFKTIVFSDTILIFNKLAPVSIHDHTYLVMYACEFVQDLMFRTRFLNIPFRAILTYGEFDYQQLQNIEAYHGQALIKAYYKEKEINGQGLFIDKSIGHFNKIFPMAEFDNDLNFVFLLQTLERLHSYGEFNLPLDKILVEQTYELFNLDGDVKILENLYINVLQQKDSRVRGKYLETYRQYQKRYSWLMKLWEDNNFDSKIICPTADWSSLKKEF